jgi:hypothetical protein
MKIIFLFLFFVITALPVSAQFKPEAMILPITFVNFKDFAIQESLINFVQTELSRNFEIKSEDEVAEAIEKAGDEIDSENCTEEACIKIMGKILDVDYTFNLKIIDTGQVWDLIAIRIQPFDDFTIRRTELCKDCSLTKARKSISAMLSTMGTSKVSLKGGKSRLIVESTPKSEVFIDGYPHGETPLDLSVDANKSFDILMVAEWYNDFTEELILKPSQKLTINKKLVRKKGNIRITSEPSGATIYRDGKKELDAQEMITKTPADLYMLFGEVEITLKKEKHEDITETLIINKRKLGIKHIILKPKPGRLIIRVPSEFKSAEVYLDGNSIGVMDGKIDKTFEVTANVSHTIQVKQEDFESKIENFEVDPVDRKIIEFIDFSDLRLVELRNDNEVKKEFKDRQDRLELERRIKEQIAKIKKLFEDTRIEIRTFGHMLDAEAYSSYFYFDPKFGIGYVTGKQKNKETGSLPKEGGITITAPGGPTEDSCDYPCEGSILKYSTEISGFVVRFRYSLLELGSWNYPKNYFFDSWGLSLFSGSGKATSQSGAISKIKPSGVTIDYVWYLENGISILFGLGLINYNAEEEWIRNYEHFYGSTDWSWGLLNIGYMF